nr:hypothetical protein [Tanacetum cinerariifolium]
MSYTDVRLYHYQKTPLPMLKLAFPGETYDYQLSSLSIGSAFFFFFFLLVNTDILYFKIQFFGLSFTCCYYMRRMQSFFTDMIQTYSVPVTKKCNEIQELEPLSCFFVGF